MASTGRENENCVGLKLAKTLAPNCTRYMIGPIVFRPMD